MNTAVRRIAFATLAFPVVFSFGVTTAQIAPTEAQTTAQAQQPTSTASLDPDAVKVPMVVVVAGCSGVAALTVWAGYRRTQIFA